MKVLILQDYPVGYPEEKFSIAKGFERAFLRAGHTAMAINTNGKKREDVLLISGSFDTVFVPQNYFLETVDYVAELNGIKIFWSIDSHKDLERHKKYVVDNKIDITLVAGYDYVQSFKDAYWFPACYPSDLITPTVFKSRPIKAGFCGSRSNRGDWIDTLVSKCGIDTKINCCAESMVNAICSYGIGFNRNESDDLNFRTFEVTGAAALLLTNKTPGLDKLFTIGNDLITYYNIEDCINKINYFGEHENERARIAMNGYVKTRQCHSYDARVAELIKIIETGEGR